MAYQKGARLEKVFGKRGKGKLIGKGGLAVSPLTGDIAVADNNAHDVKVYTSDGHFKFALDLRHQWPTWSNYEDVPDPWGVAVTTEGQYLVADHGNRVKVFDVDGKLQHSFAAVPPNRSKKLAVYARLVFVTINSENQIVVGSASAPHFISIHSAPNDGYHIMSFNVDFEPVFIACSPSGYLAINQWLRGKIQILNRNGQMLQNLHKPEAVSAWKPTGMVCYGDDILVANLGDVDNASDAGLYRFNKLSTYVDCVTKDVSDPWGMAVITESQTLVVVDDSSVKLFKLNL